MNIEKARFNMIEQQIRPWDVLDAGVLDLLGIVKREEFVPQEYKNLAFADTEVPLPCGQHMLAPKVEAKILQAVNPGKHETVLEIGAGSGYMAALLAHKARVVLALEIEAELATMAQKNLARQAVANVRVVQGNGAQGWAGDANLCAPWDVIVVSASLPTLPQEMLQQLKIGGRLAVILGEAPVMSAQIITRTGENAFDTVKLFETCVSPLREVQAAPQFKF
ncbi:protein-L-isoaspartate O-methyltransferase [Massilia sp. W12]|uniref:protein-L-isoaspartate O-methyltransferase family protein n=1 Tax=Massilia sp. W12 TaxID=3126507 RepID=UPI0030D459F9